MYRHISETTRDITTPTQQNPFNYMYSTLHGCIYQQEAGYEPCTDVNVWTRVVNAVLVFWEGPGNKAYRYTQRYVLHGVGGIGIHRDMYCMEWEV